MQQIRNQIVPAGQNATANQNSGGNNRILDPTGMKPTQLFTSAAVQRLLTNTFKSDQKAAVVTSTLLSILNISPRFQNCNGMELLGNVLRYEIAMGLSWAMGDYAVIDYGGKPTFQLQYQGVAKMAFASGKYADGDWYEVRKGEYKGLDPRTRRPVIQWIEDDAERISKPIIGYYVWVQLIDAPPYNGKIVGLYMSHDAILRHADTYSKPFQRLGGYKGYMAAMDGKRDYIKAGDTPWFAPPDSGSHMKMCKKTVLLQLLKNPFLPKSNGIFDTYVEADEIQEQTGVATTFDDEYSRMAREAALAAQMEAPRIEATPESIPAHPEQKPAETASRASEGYAQPAPVQPAESPAPQKRTRTAKKAEPPAPVQPAPPAPATEQPDFPDMSGEPRFGPDDDDDPFGEPNW